MNIIMDKNVLMKALKKGKRIFNNPEPLYTYDEIIIGVNINGKKMKAVANNTFMAFGYPLNENAKKVKKVYEDYFISNKSKIINGLVNVNSLDDMDTIERTIYKDIYLKLTEVKAERLDSYNRIRKPINLYLEHIMSMCNSIDNAQRERMVPYMFLPMDKFIFNSPYIFNSYERRRWKINGSSGFGVVRTEELFYEMQNCLIEKANVISKKLNNKFYRIYFDMFWGNRIESSETNLFLSNLNKAESKPKETNFDLIYKYKFENTNIENEKGKEKFIDLDIKFLNRGNTFKDIKSGTLWELDEFISIVESYFGRESNVLRIINQIYHGLEQVKRKINVKKRKERDAVIRFKEGGNIATFWFNNNSVTIRVVGDEVFDKQRTINNVVELKKLNVVDIISRKAN